MTANAARRPLTHAWPAAVAAPVGGGLIKLGGGSTWAATIVAAAPYAVYVLACLVFLLGYLTAVIRYVCSGEKGQEAMERLITISANAVVGILTLTRVPGPRSRPGAHNPDHARRQRM
jgi:hypothetical protein